MIQIYLIDRFDLCLLRGKDTMPSFTTSLEKSIHYALALATARKHELATLEHLLLALLEEEDTLNVMRACKVSLDDLRAQLTQFLDNELDSLINDSQASEASPTTAFQRVIQRAAIHVQSSGKSEVTGANVLVSISPNVKAMRHIFCKNKI